MAFDLRPMVNLTVTSADVLAANFYYVIANYIESSIINKEKKNSLQLKADLPYIQNGKSDELDADNHPFSYLRSLSHHIRPEQLQVAPQ